ncbi:MAG: DUF1080 domain-containing protein [Planctomycetales bacterium]|nr:DUF1080 domain-containing protein [Planctomycetales bacterium]
MQSFLQKLGLPSIALAISLVQAIAVAEPPARIDDSKPLDESIFSPKDFERGKTVTLFDGRTMRGWKVLNKIDFDKHGRVEVRGGAIEFARGNPGTGIVMQGTPPRLDYELSLEARRTGGDDFFCGLTFPYRKQHATLILGGWGGKSTGISNVNGDAAIENETSSFVDFEQDRWYRIRLRVTSERIRAWVDDEEIVDLATAGKEFAVWWEQEPARPLGIVSWHTAASFRKLMLKPVGKDAPKPESESTPPSKSSPRPAEAPRR